jgi:hypothetical protein
MWVLLQHVQLAQLHGMQQALTWSFPLCISDMHVLMQSIT